MTDTQRRAPELTDAQIDALLARAASDPQAATVGFHPPQDGDCFYRFSKSGAGPFLGDHSVGDGVSHAYFREAVKLILQCRGNHGGSRAVVDAYWDIVHNSPDDWTTSTALTLCQVAPLQGVMADQARDFA